MKTDVKKLNEQQRAETVEAVRFISELMRLKTVPRLGWLLRGIRDVESVADHSFGVALIAMLLSDHCRAKSLEVNVERVLRMALLHDFVEVRTGDLPSNIKRYFDPRELHAANSQAASEILSQAGLEGQEYLALWHEYEARTSLEAQIVKAADKLDLLFQALEYEKGGARSLDEFWLNSELLTSVPELNDLIADLHRVLLQTREDIQGR